MSRPTFKVSQTPLPAASSPLPEGSPTPAPPYRSYSSRLSWTTEMLDFLIEQLEEVVLAGQQGETYSFTNSQKKSIARQMTVLFGKELDFRHVDNKINSLKRTWNAWEAHLKHVSGWSGYPPRSTEELEKAHYAANKNCKPFEGGLLPPYHDKCPLLFGNNMTTGDNVRSARSLADGSDDDNDDAAGEDIAAEDRDAADEVRSQSSQRSATPASRGGSSSGRSNRRVHRREEAEDGQTSEAALSRILDRFVAQYRVAASPMEPLRTRIVARVRQIQQFKDLSTNEQLAILASLNDDERLAETVCGLEGDDAMIMSFLQQQTSARRFNQPHSTLPPLVQTLPGVDRAATPSNAADRGIPGNMSMPPNTQWSQMSTEQWPGQGSW